MKKQNKFNICTLPQAAPASVFSGLPESDISFLLGGNITVPFEDKGQDYYTLNLCEVEYDKGVFAPCALNLHFTVTAAGSPKVSLLKQYLADVRTEQYTDKDGNVKTETVEVETLVDVFTYNVQASEADSDNRIPICSHYYVHGIDFSRTADNKSECVLRCFSYDKKITGKRGCAVYSGSEFGSKVFSSELDSTELKGMYSCGTESLLMMGYDGTTSPPSRDGKHDMELKHPYLVRYNESSYDFLSRVAHRCGEFLCFEEGKLRLGLPEKTINALVSGVFPELDSVPLCSYPEIGGDEDDDTPDFSTDYVTGKLETSGSGAVYDMQHSADEYLRLVSSDDRLKSTLDWWILCKALSMFFTCKDCVAGIITSAWNAVMDLIEGGLLVPAQIEDEFNGTYVEKNNDYATLLSSDSKSAVMENLCNVFYHIVEKLEEKSERGKVVLNFSDIYPLLKPDTLQQDVAGQQQVSDQAPSPLMLGTAFSLPDGIFDSYVVSRIYGKYSYRDSALCSSNCVEAVPVLSDSISDVKKIASGLQRIVVPPRGTVPHFRESGPLEALVSRNDDPLELNRVKIRYPWQFNSEDDKMEQVISPWVRVMVPFAGSKDTSGGFTMMLDVNEHVAVKYLSGNMERPYVDGSLHFRKHPPFLGTPDITTYFLTGGFKTRSIASSNGHRFMLNDTPDTSMLSQMVPLLGTIMSVCMPTNDYNESTGQVLGGGVTLMDGSGMCTLNMSPDRRSISVSSNFGTVDISAFTGMTISAPNGDINICGKNVIIEAGNNLSIQSGANIKSEKPDYWSDLSEVVGEAAAELAANALKAYTGVDISGCLDMSFLRCLYEIIMRPVEGTLSLKSNRNTVVTAGRGVANIPRSMMSETSKFSKKLKGWTSSDTFDPPSTRAAVASYMEWFMTAIDSFHESLRNDYEAISDLHDSLYRMLKRNKSRLSTDFENNIVAKQTYLFEKAWKGDPVMKDTDVLVVPTLPENQKIYKQYKKDYENLKEKIDGYKKQYPLRNLSGGGRLKEVFDKISKGKDGWNNIKIDNFPQKCRKDLCDITRDEDFRDFNPAADANRTKLDEIKKIQKRSTIVQMLVACGYSFYTNGGQLSNQQDMNGRTSNSGDNALIKLIEGETAGFKAKIRMSLSEPSAQQDDGSKIKNFFTNSTVGTALSAVIRPLGGGVSFNPVTQQWDVAPGISKILNMDGSAGPRALWEVSTKGNVIMSSENGGSLHLKNDSTGWERSQNVGNPGNPASIVDLIDTFDLD